jgi:hypothetical protein
MRESGMNVLVRYLKRHPEGVEKVAESEIVLNVTNVLQSDISSLFHLFQ